MRVLPSACAPVRDLAGSPATVETYTSIPRFHSSRLDQKSRMRIANHFRRLLWKSETQFSGVHKALTGLKLQAGTCHWTRRVAVTRDRGPRNQLRRIASNKRERATLAGILNDYVSARFPAYAESQSGADVVGIPGFWQKLSGVVHIWKPRNYLMPLLVIPYKGNGLIQAC